MKIIAVMASKGGQGKSTLSANIAAYLSQQHRVKLIDGNGKQSSVSRWFYRREALGKTTNLQIAEANNHKTMHNQLIKAQNEGVDHVIIDTTPGMTDTDLAALQFADLVIIPAIPNGDEIESIQTLLMPHVKAWSKANNLPYFTIFNQVNAQDADHRLTIIDTKDSELNPLPIRIGFRPAFRKAFRQGLTGYEFKHSSTQAATEELESLTKVVLKFTHEK